MLGPGIPHSALPADAETQWVSVGGDVVEAACWFGPLAPDGPGHSALLLHEDGSRTVLRGTGTAQAPTGPLGEYLHEPDGAVIRAGLVAEAAAEVHGRLIDPTIAYVTSDAPATTRAVTSYRVLDDLPFGVKRLRTYLRERGVGTLTVKKRGTAVVPEELRRQLDLRGDRAATVVLTRVAGQQRVLVVEPVGPGVRSEATGAGAPDQPAAPAR